MTDIAVDIVATMRHPVLVLDKELRVQSVNPAFRDVFEVSADETEGRPLHEIGNCQWDIPELRRLLNDLFENRPEITDFRVQHEFEKIGRRTMLLNARRMERDGVAAILLAIEDITERERLLWELEAQKEYAEKIIDASRDALLVLDRDFRVKSANQTFYDTFKADPQETEGRLFWELCNRQWDLPKLRELLENVLLESNAFDDFEVVHHFESVGRRDMILNGRKIDHRQWILLAIEDVTERKLSMQALRASEERLRLIVESARDYAIFTTDSEGIINGWHAGAQSVFGWSAEEAIGRDPEFLFTPEDQARGTVRCELRSAARDGTAADVRWHLHKDGSRVFIEGRVMALRDASGELTGFLKIGQDVTERRRAEERLRQSEERLRKVLETEAVGVIFFNEAEYAIGANKAFLKMTGYSRTEVESGDMHWRDLTPPEWFEVSTEQWKKLKETGHIGPYEKECLHKDGSRSWMLLTGRDLGDGTTVEYCFDISGRKEAEEHRELLLAELNHRVKNTLAVVQGLASQTIARSKSLQEFQRAFQGRLAALARGHAQLLRGEWTAADLGRLVEEAVSAFGPGRVQARGPVVRVSPRVALSLNLVLHELETNSAKYGALSVKEGHVDIEWTREENGVIHLVWREGGGPTVTPPEREGFGTKLIKQVIQYELDGEAQLNFEPGGLRTDLTFSTSGVA